MTNHNSKIKIQSGGNMEKLPEIYTPSSLMNIIKNLWLSHAEKKLIDIEGIYHKSGKTNYAGYYYDSISDSANQALTLKISKQIRDDIQDGNVYVFKVNIERRIGKDGKLDVICVPALNMLPILVKKSLLKQESARSKLLKKKNAKQEVTADDFFKSKIRKKHRINIAMIFGVTSNTKDDVLNQIPINNKYFDINEFPININDSNEMLLFLDDMRIIKTDVIAFVRGGGEGIGTFEDIELAERALDAPPMIFSAIGHSNDSTLFDLIADKSFDTPTALGVYLKEISDNGSTFTFKTAVNIAVYISAGIALGLLAAKFMF